MAPSSELLKVDLRIEVNGQPLAICAQVQGEGEHARRAAAELSAVIANLLAAMARPSGTAAAEGVVAEGRSTSQLSMVAAQPTTASSVPESGADGSKQEGDAGLTARRTSSLPPPSDDSSAPVEPASVGAASSAIVIQMQRHRAKISLGFGALLLALAVLVPIIVPADQRSEVLIITILFSLTGALLLFTAMLPGRGSQVMLAAGVREREVRPTLAAKESANAARLRLSHVRRAPMKAGWGIALGIAFVLLGMFAPFTLGATTADERFIIMLGFAPITVVGFFLIAIFGRGLFARLLPQQTVTGSTRAARPVDAPAAKRPSVPRVPQTFEFRTIVPVAIIGLLVVMIGVVILVIYATVASAVR